MIKINEMSQSELAAYVQSHLRQAGIEVILSGGALVAFYTENRYVSMDIDLVNMYFTNRKKLIPLMEELGFKEQGRHFIHLESPYWIEFPPGPLAVGRTPVKEILSFPLKTGILKVLSPTDCIKDRLLAFFHWDDQQCLEQAKLIAKSYPPDWVELVNWAIAEESLEKYRKIEAYLHSEA